MIIQKLVVKTGTDCSLRCEKCGEFNPYLREKGRHFTLTAANLLKDIFPVISSAEKIKTVHIAGGEPFLHKDLLQSLCCLAVFPQIDEIEVVTNGTVVPDDITLSALSNLREKIIILISDYSGAGIDNTKLTASLKTNGVNYHVQKDMIWKDKSDTSFKGYARNDLIDIAGNCPTFRKDYFSLTDGIITAHCPTAGSLLYYHNLYGEMSDLFCNVRETNISELPEKLKLLNDFPYTPMCNYCVPTNKAENCLAGGQL